MNMDLEFNDRDTMVMKLLHFFIIEENYNPIVLHGAKDEIWLENMHENYKIVRIVSNYIHNDEQLETDLYRTKRIAKDIKRKTLNLNMEVLSIFLDLGENVNLRNEKNIDCVYIRNEKDVKNYQFLLEIYPDMDKKLTFTEQGMNLFLKITNEINENNKKKAEKIDKIFKPKKPIFTYILIAINILVFLLEILMGDTLLERFSLYGPAVKAGEYYRLLTSQFLHVNIFHLACNMYALAVIGNQVETLFGKVKYLIIYLISGLTGSLLSMLLNVNVASVGASGVIFGLLGAILYFGYNYRAYLGNYVMKSILPVVILNLVIGFIVSGIDNFAHIGGLVGGILISSALGISNEEKNPSQVNGIIITILYIIFLIYMNFIH